MSTKPIFLLDQRLSLLKPGHSPLQNLDVAAAENRRDRGGFREETGLSPWEDLSRDAWLAYHRTIVVADAGLGKTWNLLWFSRHVYRQREGYIPFFISIEDLPDSPNGSLEPMYGALLKVWRDAAGCGEDSQLSSTDAIEVLRELRAEGRLILVLDSLDQALSNEGAVHTLKLLMTHSDWKACPMVVSTRPHALTSQWEKWLGALADDWRFIRVEEMDEKQQKYLLGDIPGEDGQPVSRYSLIPDEGKRLLGVPRVIELLCNPKLTWQDFQIIKTMTDVYWKCTNEMLLEGLKAKKAGNEVEWNVKLEGEVNEEFREVQRDIARNIFGAVAFKMMIADPKRPNLAFVPKTECTAFLRNVSALIQHTRTRHRAEGRDEELECLGCANGYKGFLRNFTAITALNAGQMDSYLMDAAGRRNSDLKFRNPTMQAFFAAAWVCRHGTPEDIERLKGWVVSPWDERFGQYQEFWRFVSEFGGTGKWDPSAVRNDWWVDVIGVVYRSPVRMCQFIYRSWNRMKELNAKARAEFLAEFPAIRAGEHGADKKRIAVEMMTGFIRLVGNPILKGDTGTFWMGATKRLEDMPPGSFDPVDPPPVDPEAIDYEFPPHQVTLSPYSLHRYCVTNAEYELFDPAHGNKRSFTDKVSAEDLARHPVVNVDWWDGWAFAAWCGCALPTEAQWEYANRAGTRSPFAVGDGQTLTQEMCNFYYEIGRTIAVDGLPANAWGFFQMTGNVLEWCADWYDEYGRSPPADPVGPKSGSGRVFRGGSWIYDAWSCRAALRDWDSPDLRDDYLGFRLAAGPSKSSLSPEAERSVGA
ncbi:MAG: SUMF1/EgtB/PvdO family nonheme iron enzyme [Gemmataceae bacterium]|nr:SUMF1/EgtB/PvdO family nonheme iron enzyme [Gemmataceae bacterium]